MNRFQLAKSFHEKGYNCAQAVAASFADLTGLSLEQTLAVAGGFGGGVGGSHQELCGAISGGVMVLSQLFPHLKEGDREGKYALYDLVADFRKRFLEIFQLSRCEDLLAAEPGLGASTKEAAKLGLTAPCDILIVTAVQLVEEMLREKHIL